MGKMRYMYYVRFFLKRYHRIAYMKLKMNNDILKFRQNIHSSILDIFAQSKISRATVKRIYFSDTELLSHNVLQFQFLNKTY